MTRRVLTLQGPGIYHGEISLQSIHFERDWGEQVETAESYFPPGTLDLDYGKLAKSIATVRRETSPNTPHPEERIADKTDLTEPR
jgi:hypothetical protein